MDSRPRTFNAIGDKFGLVSKTHRYFAHPAMADYNLNALNSRDFQHLVQAIGRKRIAPGVIAFGDGKDGNRDLVYDGTMDYPSVQNAWDGYLILGCKFRQVGSGGRRKDAEWATQQLKKDLEKFLDTKRDLRKPDYYIFVTNVALTGVAESGGRDRITKVLEDFTPTLGLKGAGCWDYNDLRGFIDGDEDIRRAYGHFITAGDVLSEMMAALGPTHADFGDVMSIFLQKELLGDMAAKLQSAGEDPDVQIPLANVFVDLPVAESAADAYSSRDPKSILFCIDVLLSAGNCVLRRAPSESRPLNDAQAPDNSRFVLVGGPGQGKSTLGQYLCQLYRAAILNDRPRDRVDDKVPSAIKQLEKQREDAGGLPAIRRFPVRVELRSLAHAVANDTDLTLLEYIRRQIARLGSAIVELADLKRWMSIYPWLVVLDGLDEVPPSSNRDDVVRLIEHFRIDTASCNSDIFMVVTTRPQSYSREFPSELFKHLYLRPLEPADAMRYGRLLANARCGADERRREDLVTSLTKACGNKATSRLMQSPLQVTIMATLLEETGEPPQQRYRLFAEYYRTIYKRETRRKLLEGILSERQTDIDLIHNVAGLLLHAGSEMLTKGDEGAEFGDADAALSDAQFRELVRRRLAQIRVPQMQADELLNRITDGSLQRLVFLVRPKEGWVRFDIPSLKEFMAAEALMSGPDEQVRDRLKVIAPATYWRNVLLFAIGKCFVDKEYLLDTVVGICDVLNDEVQATTIFGSEIAGKASRLTRWGSRVALDVLNDGSPRQYPDYEHRLTRIALELLRIADTEAAARLSSTYHEDLAQSFREAIEDRLGQSEFSRQRGAWALLISLADRGVDWAHELINRDWPSDPAQQWEVIDAYGPSQLQPWLIERIASALPFLDVHRLHHLAHVRALEEFEGTPNSPWWRPVSRLLGRHFFSRRSGTPPSLLQVRHQAPTLRDTCTFHIVPVHEKGIEWIRGLESLPSDHHVSWAPYVAAARFSLDPSHHTLAQQLRWLADASKVDQLSYWFDKFPWPFSACVRTAGSPAELRKMADRAEAGALGTLDSWQRAEQRWVEDGLTFDDYSSITDDRWPFDDKTWESGFPFAAAELSWPNDESGATQMLLDIFKKVAPQRLKAWIANQILSAFQVWPYSPRKPIDMSIDEIVEVFHASQHDGNGRLPFQWLMHLQPSGTDEAKWIDLLNSAANESQMFFGADMRIPATQQLCSIFSTDPDRYRGLLQVLGWCAYAGNRCLVPPEILDRCRSWDDRSSAAALVLAIARGDWSTSQLQELTEKVIEHDRNMHLVWRVLFMAERLFSNEQAAVVALAFLNAFSKSDRKSAEAQDRLLAVLVDYLTKRPSLLDDVVTWKRLALPEKV